jgi:hypothetical protein
LFNFFLPTEIFLLGRPGIAHLEVEAAGKYSRFLYTIRIMTELLSEGGENES